TINNGSSYCGSSIPVIEATSTSTSTEDGYLYVIADAGGAIVGTFDVSFDAGSLAPGTYTLFGLSYMGTISGLDGLNSIASDVCFEWSDNSIEFSILDCPYVVFNELNIDNPGGGDVTEFIELYGTPEASLDNLVLVLFEGSTDDSYGAYDLDGYSLDENGFFVIGNAATENVDFVIPDATISNGGDGVGLYIGNDTDFPNGTLPTTVNLIEAAVYGTGDATDIQLIAALGLDVAVPGYTQLDETFQQTLPDFSLSRYPDGGQPFNFSPYVLQDVTPGTWNQPQCMADSIFSSGAASFCDNDPIAVAVWTDGSNGYGEHATFIVTDDANNILELSDAMSYNFTGFAVGTYHIFALAYNGTLDSTTIAAGSNIVGITAGNCVSLSDNFLIIEITPCSGCVGGEINLLSGIAQVCNTATTPLALSSTSTSLDDTYVFVLTDTAGTILAVDASAFSVEGLAAGTYSVAGISYQGSVTGLTIGSPLSGVTASNCLEFSSNTLSIEVFACTDNTPCTELFFSEYLEGTNGTKALEIFNPSLASVDLSEYSIVQYANGAAAPTNTLALTGTLGPFGTYVIANPGQGGGGGAASQTVLGLADLVNQIANYNGNDALELRHNDTIIDVIGVVGENPGTGAGWPVGNATTFDVDLVRQFNIQSPMPVWAISAGQWDVYAVNDYSHLGNHFFQPCSDETLAGFVNGDINVAENAGTITINVQCLNANGPITIIASLQGGTADNTDYTAVLPDTLYFNDVTALQNFTI
ncbi:MAG: lamin tail domain-containing protein, partial [Flavobacteriales bacterium]